MQNPQLYTTRTSQIFIRTATIPKMRSRIVHWKGTEMGKQVLAGGHADQRHTYLARHHPRLGHRGGSRLLLSLYLQLPRAGVSQRGCLRLDKETHALYDLTIVFQDLPSIL